MQRYILYVTPVVALAVQVNFSFDGAAVNCKFVGLAITVLEGVTFSTFDISLLSAIGLAEPTFFIA